MGTYGGARDGTRVGGYVDAFNVYYGGRALAGRGTSGWRWLDLAGLARSLIRTDGWPDPRITRVAYCTAMRSREDVLQGRVDAAIVLSNDSDLGCPLRLARQHTPVATVNPREGSTAQDLRGRADDGVGRHWWRTLGISDLTANQLPDLVGPHRRPPGW